MGKFLDAMSAEMQDAARVLSLYGLRRLVKYHLVRGEMALSESSLEAAAESTAKAVTERGNFAEVLEMAKNIKETGVPSKEIGECLERLDQLKLI